MVKIGNGLKRDTRAILSDMNEPLGLAVGNALEVKEAIAALQGNGPEDLMELCYKAGAVMLKQANIAHSDEEGRAMLEKVIKDGSAFETFVNMVEAQGGDISYIRHPEKFEMASKIVPIYAQDDGYVKFLNALEIGLSSMRLGGGRETLEDKIDMSAGIMLVKKIGDKVKKGDVLCYLHTNKSDDVVKQESEIVSKAYTITKGFIEKPNVVLEIIQ